MAVVALRGGGAVIDLVLFYARCFGLFHRWVQPECDRDGLSAWDLGMSSALCDCPYKRVCVRCGAERETRDDE